MEKLKYFLKMCQNLSKFCKFKKFLENSLHVGYRLRIDSIGDPGVINFSPLGFSDGVRRPPVLLPELFPIL